MSDVYLTKPQASFLTSKKKFCLFRAGIGSGKSFVGSHYVIKKISEDPESKGFIGANTYRQLHNATLSALFSTLDKHGYPYQYNQNKGILNILGRKIIVDSLTNYEMLRGIEIGWFWLDEVRDTKEDAFRVLMGRLRDKSAKSLEGRLTSSPFGYDWQYDYFEGEKKTKEFQVVQGKTQDNIYLPEGYIETLKENYDDKIYRQEVLGEIVNIQAGQIYYSFDRSKHVEEFELNKRLPIYFGMDFNINPMTACLVQPVNDVVHVYDEFYLMGSNTKEIGEEIIRRYGPKHRIIPDSTGKRTQTSSSGFSDHMILRDMGFRVIHRPNPFRIDRYNCVNNLLDKGCLKIHPRCKNLIKDMERLHYKEGDSRPDLSKDQSLGHLSDGLGYACYYFYPLEKVESEVHQLPR